MGILAATTITCVTGGFVHGDIGNSPGTALTGFRTMSAQRHQSIWVTEFAAQAQLDLTAAFKHAQWAVHALARISFPQILVETTKFTGSLLLPLDPAWVLQAH
jgi:hypothetical protein